MKTYTYTIENVVENMKTFSDDTQTVELDRSYLDGEIERWELEELFDLIDGDAICEGDEFLFLVNEK